jgi:hypothetical protein
MNGVGAAAAGEAAYAPFLVHHPKGRRQIESDLYAAVKSGDSRRVMTALAGKADPNRGGEDGFTPLMTAAEAGHAVVVNLLCQHPLTLVNAQNMYGQTALSFAAQNGRLDAVLVLCSARGADGPVNFELVSNTGFTAAQSARSAGRSAIADVIALAAREQQMETASRALFGVGDTDPPAFDSLRDRLASLFPLSQLPAPQFPIDNDDFDLELDESRLCVVCMDANIETALVPCFHAQFCADCAKSLRGCPVCRGAVHRVQRIYLP